MTTTTFSAELTQNRAAYERLKEQIRSAEPGQYATIAQGRLIALSGTFDEAVAAAQQLQPPPEHFLVFPVEDEPAFDVIDDFSQRL